MFLNKLKNLLKSTKFGNRGTFCRFCILWMFFFQIFFLIGPNLFSFSSMFTVTFHVVFERPISCKSSPLTTKQWLLALQFVNVLKFKVIFWSYKFETLLHLKHFIKKLLIGFQDRHRVQCQERVQPQPDDARLHLGENKFPLSFNSN